MADHELSAADKARMQMPLWEQAKHALGRDNGEEAALLIDRAVEQWSALKDYSINWITSLLTFIGDELGEEARHGHRVGIAAGLGAREGHCPGDAREHGRGRGRRG